jgi:hypothetical protein
MADCIIDHVDIRVSDISVSRNGGTSIGDPGKRPEYSKGYYGAFVLDPDGNNVEAVVREG